MMDEAGWWASIDAAPGDMVVLGAFADWLAEGGDPRAAPVRWCYECRRVPTALEGQPWGWFGPLAAHVDRHANLPHDLFHPLFWMRNKGAVGGPADAYKRVCSAWATCVREGTPLPLLPSDLLAESPA